jgi:hypothetical protein
LLGIRKHIGEAAAETVEDLLYKNVIDEATSANEIQKIISEINAAINRINQIKEGLNGLIQDDEDTKNGELLLRVSFSKAASISNVNDFKLWGSTWYDIGRGVAMAHGLTPEDIRIVGASKGSVILTLAVSKIVAKTLSSIVLDALKVAEKFYRIKQQIEEVRALKLSNDKAVQELEIEAQKVKEDGATIIYENLISDPQIAKSNGEVRNALEKATKNLVGFIEKGGEVDCVLPPEENKEGEKTIQDQELAVLRKAFQEIRFLEQKNRQLEYKEKPDHGKD